MFGCMSGDVRVAMVEGEIGGCEDMYKLILLIEDLCEVTEVTCRRVILLSHLTMILTCPHDPSHRGYRERSGVSYNMMNGCLSLCMMILM